MTTKNPAIFNYWDILVVFLAGSASGIGFMLAALTIQPEPQLYFAEFNGHVIDYDISAEDCIRYHRSARDLICYEMEDYDADLFAPLPRPR